jgi:PKD repeat protein
MDATKLRAFVLFLVLAALLSTCSQLTPLRNLKPVATFEIKDKVRTNAGEFSVEFNVFHDDDSEVCYQKWDFGDGASETRSVGCTLDRNPQPQSFRRTYRTQRGSFIVTLRVIDDDSMESAPYQQTLALRENRLPVADFTQTVDPLESTLLTFNASVSSDPDPEDVGLLRFKWDFGDASGEQNADRNPIIQHSFKRGTFVVTLTTEDTEKAQSTIKKAVKVE